MPGGTSYGSLLGNGKGEGLLRGFTSFEWLTSKASNEAHIFGENERWASYIPSKDSFRIDISPHLGSIGRELLALSNASQIYIEPGDLSLIKPGWEYQSNVFYSHDLGVDELGSAKSLDNAVQYFGTEYVLLDAEKDRGDIYKDAGWDFIHQEGELQLWGYPGNIELASHTSRPAILITEKPGREIFMTIFRLASDGFLPYEEAMLVEGRERIDQYALEDLLHFDVVFLVGYDYRNRNRAWDTLENYVKQGGSLFVDTGWQFAVAEWEFERTPDILPISRLDWTNYGMADEYELGSIEIT
ncbi:unnamed protein product, partial [marine sediment metagenome]